MPVLNFDQLTPIQQKVLKVCPTYQKFLEQNKPDFLLVTFSGVTTIEQSIERTRMQISDLEIVYPDAQNTSEDYFKKWLMRLNSILNIQKPLTEIDTVAYMLYSGYRHLYLSDLKLILEKLIRGEYGQFYATVDAQRIMQGFILYDKERNKLITRKQQESKAFDNKPGEQTELDIYLKHVSTKIIDEVGHLMRTQFKHLRPLEILSKQASLITERCNKELPIAREEFLKRQQQQPITT